MKNVVLFTSFANMERAINNKNYKVIATFKRKDKLLEFCKDTLEPINVLFFVENKNEDNIDFLLDFNGYMPLTRIIYISPDIDLNNSAIVERVCSLIDKGINDIYYGEKITKQTIQDLLNNPRTRSDNIGFLDLRKQLRESIFEKYAEERKGEEPEEDDDESLEFEWSDEEEDDFVGEVSDGYNNVVVVSSIKPGTGKSFISTNLAASIAKFGKKKVNGEAPRVAIIEGDLQTLAVGTLLKVENERYNLKTALRAVQKVMDEDGNNFGSDQENRAVKELILRCFHSYREIPNLYVLCASQVHFEDWMDINPYRYFYMIESIVEEFDVIIIDSNSALEHRTTGPILQLANVCLYVIDLEYNNIRMNMRYKQTLSELGLEEKIRYILNKDIPKQLANKFAEPLEYDANALAKDFKVLARIPIIDSSVILNRLHNGRPIILDTTPATLDARMEFTNIADKIWDMDNILSLKLEKEVELQKLEKEKDMVDKLFRDEK